MPPSAAVPTTDSSAGLITSNRAPEDASRNSPSMNRRPSYSSATAPWPPFSAVEGISSGKCPPPRRSVIKNRKRVVAQELPAVLVAEIAHPLVEVGGFGQPLR